MDTIWVIETPNAYENSVQLGFVRFSIVAAQLYSVVNGS